MRSRIWRTALTGAGSPRGCAGRTAQVWEVASGREVSSSRWAPGGGPGRGLQPRRSATGLGVHRSVGHGLGPDRPPRALHPTRASSRRAGITASPMASPSLRMGDGWPRAAMTGLCGSGTRTRAGLSLIAPFRAMPVAGPRRGLPPRWPAARLQRRATESSRSGTWPPDSNGAGNSAVTPAPSGAIAFSGRWEAARLGLRGQHGEDLGRGDRPGSPHPPGPLRPRSGAVAISRDSGWLATASLDRTVKLWDGRPWTLWMRRRNGSASGG